MHFKITKEKVKKVTPLVAGPLLMLIGGLVILGWFIHSNFLIRISKTYTAMVFNTALSFTCMGAGILCLNFKWKWISRLLATFVCILNFLITMQYLFKVNLYVDNLFYTYDIPQPMFYPGRTSLNTSLTLMFGSFSLFLSTYEKTLRKTFIIVLLSCVGLAIPFSNLVGYIAGLESAASWTSFSKMALHTTICALIMNLSILICAITDILGTHIQGTALAIAVSLSTVIVTAGFWRLINTKDYISAQLVSDYEASEISSVTSQILRENIEALDRFAQRWGAEGGYSETLWQVDSSNYLDDLTPLTNIIIADPSFQIVEQTATIKNALLPNQDLYEKQLKALKRGKIAYSFNDKRDELGVFIPIFQNKVLHQFLFATLDMAIVFEAAIESIPKSSNNIIFLRGNDVLYSWNLVQSQSLGPPVQTTITEEFVPITLQISVSKEIAKKGSFAVQFIILITGLFAAIVSAGIAYFYFSSQEKGAILKILNKDLALAKANANQATLAKSSFLSSMSHEIRTPLNAVIGTLQILNETELNETQKKYLRRMDLSSRNLLNLLNDILDYSKIEAGNISLEKSPFDPLDIAREASETLIYKSAEKKVPLYIEAPCQPLPLVLGDRYRLGQIFINLITNAYKFTEKGEIILKIEPKNIENNALPIRFEIKDSGIGISPKNQKKLFQKFTQVQIADAQKSKGVGLGLSICKGLVEKMEGQIGVNSEEGKGSTFWFEVTFPLEKPGENPAPYQLENTSILVIDTEAKQRDKIVECLKAWKANVSTEYNDQLPPNTIAILSTDQNDLIQKVKEKNCPILYVENQDPSKVGDDILQKPITAKSLWTALQHKKGK